jgi:hypothetical protein
MMEDLRQITDPVEAEKAWQDLGRPETSKPISFAYTVIVDMDGSIHTQVYEIDDKVSRKANTFDIYSTSKDLISDIESQLLADRVAKTVLAYLQPTDSAKELREKLLAALSDRGIETPKA